MIPFIYDMTVKIAILLNSLSVGDNFEASLSILLTTTPSACECLNYYTGFCAFNSLSADAPTFRVTDWCIVGC